MDIYRNYALIMKPFIEKIPVKTQTCFSYSAGTVYHGIPPGYNKAAQTRLLQHASAKRYRP